MLKIYFLFFYYISTPMEVICMLTHLDQHFRFIFLYRYWIFMNHFETTDDDK